MDNKDQKSNSLQDEIKKRKSQAIQRSIDDRRSTRTANTTPAKSSALEEQKTVASPQTDHSAHTPVPNNSKRWKVFAIVGLLMVGLGISAIAIISRSIAPQVALSTVTKIAAISTQAKPTLTQAGNSPIFIASSIPATSGLSPQIMATLTAFASITPPATLTPSATPPPSGQILTINTLDDPGDGKCSSQSCSLRAAIGAAAWGATINFQPTLTGTITLKDKLKINRDITIIGPGPKSNAVVITANGPFNAFYLERGTLTLRTLTLANCKVSAIFNNMGTLIIADSTFQKNNANEGGAIDNSSGTVNISGSTFWANHAGNAGAIMNLGGTVTIVNSTFEGNTSDNTGAISNGGTMSIINSTFHGNIARLFDAADVIGNGSKLSLKNTIIEGRSMAHHSTCSTPKELGIDITDNGNNLQFPTNDCGLAIPVVDPKLAPLSDNGGATQTMALLLGSNAIAAGDRKTCAAPPINNIDQTGNLRIVEDQGNVTCDIGAFEHINSLSISTLEK